MNQTQLLHAANQEAPDLMRKVAEAISFLETDSPVFAQDLVSEINAITSYTEEKVAAASPGGYSPVARFGAAVGGTIVAGLAGSIATDLYDAARRGLTKGRNLHRIMAQNPELKKFDKTRLQQSYDALHRYAPEFTADPTLGGSLLKAVAELPGNEHTVIKDLISARKSLQEAKEKQFRPGHVSLELPDQYDIARDAANQASQLKRDAENHAHDLRMFGMKERANLKAEARREDRDVSRDSAREAFQRKQDAERRAFDAKRDSERASADLAKEKRESERRGQEGKNQFRRSLRLEEFKTRVRENPNQKLPKRDPIP